MFKYQLLMYILVGGLLLGTIYYYYYKMNNSNYKNTQNSRKIKIDEGRNREYFLIVDDNTPLLRDINKEYQCSSYRRQDVMDIVERDIVR